MARAKVECTCETFGNGVVSGNDGHLIEDCENCDAPGCQRNAAIVAAFHNAMPDILTINDAADGVVVTFTFEGKTYNVNTRVAKARTRPIDEYLQTIAQRAIDAVEDSHAAAATARAGAGARRPGSPRNGTRAGVAAPARAARDKATTEGDRMSERQTLADESTFANVLYYGKPGSGKTTAAASLAKRGRIVYVDAEAGLKSAPLLNLGVPVGNIEVHRTITYDALDALFAELWDEPPFGVVMDSLSEIHKMLLEHTVEREMRRQRDAGKSRDEQVAELRDYGINTTEMRHLVRRFRDLPCHTVFTALERRDVDENTGLVQYGPDMSQRLASDVMGYVDVACHTYTTEGDDGDEPVYMGDFRDRELYAGKDRFGVVPPRLVSPSMDRVLDYLDGTLTAETDTLSASVEAAAPAEDEPAKAAPARKRSRPPTPAEVLAKRKAAK